ncbi:MAG: LytTR family DNA-binding domain-containing protein [Candidatus Bathyarchaeota archaeon]|uniref:LytTR family DNA-binding domain-containing protein n=1 Tax=Christiangramia crocea TaxID=2904124 RepID=A0A9X2A6W7_9FLAO|nr:LytTR family DNA-binding domain-containing protein [Gramella crocea]MCG9972450.1 LytTR family DNA-binding domain-containing protein [Gramella crocea]MCZ2846280.1 LytTR family DNA-binding domain-containing protein [Candidatus Bathyarchaeota archaeon]
MKCLIVDDDPLICDLLEHFCNKVEQIESVTTASSGFETINLLNSTHFDLIFLDYDLPDINGKDILNVLNPDTSVIMVTSNKDFGSDSYNYEQVIDFLVKPVDFARFYKGFQKALVLREKENTIQKSRIFVKDGSKLVKINLEEVRYLKSEGNYISLVLKDKKILTLMTLKELEPKLPNYFQKVHRSYMVNLNKIDFIDNDGLEIEKKHIPVSKSYEKELLKKIELLN